MQKFQRCQVQPDAVSPARFVQPKPPIFSIRPGPVARAGGFELSYRLNGFRARFGHEHHRAAFIAKRPAQFAGQIFFVLVGKQFVTVDEQQKRRRRRSS
jgi:hypothetical protein